MLLFWRNCHEQSCQEQVAATEGDFEKLFKLQPAAPTHVRGGRASVESLTSVSPPAVSVIKKLLASGVQTVCES